MKYKMKKLMCSVLCIAIGLSMPACGKQKDVVIDDYAEFEGKVDESLIENTGTDAVAVTNRSGKTLQEILGKKVDFGDGFSVDDVYISTEASYSVPNLPYLNVYRMRYANDGKNQEEKIVQAIFGNTAEKIEELSYKNETDYMMLMYKYRRIIEAYKCEDEYYSNDNTSVIDSSFSEKYKWLDEKDIYIHMYEGEYNGIKYGLILSHDSITHQRHIFLDPISIDGLYPGAGYKTLLMKDKGYGGELWMQNRDINNACKLGNEQVTAAASDFLENTLMLGSGMTDVTTKAEDYMNMNGNNLSYFVYPGETETSAGDSMTQLLYTNADYISALRDSLRSGFNPGYQILCEQEDRYKNEAKDNTSIYEFIATGAEGEPLEYDADGYVVYLDSNMHEETDESGKGISFGSSAEVMSSNYGYIKVNDKGVVGLDIVLIEEEAEVIENVEIVSFDKIRESLKSQIGEKINIKDMKSSTVHLAYLELVYYPYTKGEGNNSTEFSYIPVWLVYIVPEGYATIATFTINAMDGEIIEAQVHDVETVD